MINFFWTLSGEIIDQTQLRASFDFRPLVFETMRTYKSPAGDFIFALEDHLDRLWHSVDVLKLKIFDSKKEQKKCHQQIQKKISEILVKSRLQNRNNLLKIKLNLGSKFFELQISSLEVPKEEIYRRGVSVGEAVFERNFPSAKYPSPAYQYFFQSQKKDHFETIFFDRDGFLTEGNISNVFAFFAEELWTPKKNILEGITRKKVLEIAQAIEIPRREKEITREKLLSAQEIFLTNSTKEIIPVSNWGDWQNKNFFQTKILHSAFAQKIGS